MKGKIKFLSLALATSIVLNSQVFAVTYLPDKDVNINKDNIETLDKIYNEEDAKKVLEIFSNNDITEESLERYDVNEDGLVDSADAAVILNLVKYSE